MAELDLKVGKTFVAEINTNPEMTPMQARRMRSSMREYPVRFRSPSFLRERTFISTPQQNSATFPAHRMACSRNRRGHKRVLMTETATNRAKGRHCPPANI